MPQKPVDSDDTAGDRGSSRRQRFEQSQTDDDEKPLSIHSEDDLGQLTIKSLNDHVFSMLTDVKLIIPVVTAIIMITVGDIFYDTIQDLRGEGAETGFGHAFKLVVSAFAYFVVYGCGTMILWYVCSVLFRESARGEHNVSSWRSHGFDEMKSTFLLFSFSFALAGLPLLVLPTYISAPVRIMVAPLLLLVAWFNQFAFVGVAFEPFATLKTQSRSWQQFYVYVAGLALATLIGGLLFYVPYCSIIAAIMIAAAALAFAAATGWHIGRTIKMMEN